MSDQYNSTVYLFTTCMCVVCIIITAMVRGVSVELQLTATSVRVTWEKISLPAISSYTVYYSAEGVREQSQTVPSSENSVVIMDLKNDVEYAYQVVAVGIVNRQEISGERSVITDQSAVLIPPCSEGYTNYTIL